jgi:hypothetical protein
VSASRRITELLEFLAQLGNFSESLKHSFSVFLAQLGIAEKSQQRPNWFLGRTSASGGNPFYQKMNIYFFKITKFFLIYFASVLASERPNWFLGRTSASGGNPFYRKMNIYFLKITKFFLIYFVSVLASERPNRFLDQTSASGGNPSYQKMNIYFFKITKFFLIYFASVLASRKPNWFLGPTSASGGNPSYQKMNIYFFKITNFFKFFLEMNLSWFKKIQIHFLIGRVATTGWGWAQKSIRPSWTRNQCEKKIRKNFAHFSRFLRPQAINFLLCVWNRLTFARLKIHI